MVRPRMENVAVARRIIEANGGASNLAERCFEEVARGDAGLVLGDGFVVDGVGEQVHDGGDNAALV